MRTLYVVGAMLISAALMAQATKQWTLQELFQRNIGTKEQQDTAFPPHQIIGNMYYVGSQSFGTFLVTTLCRTHPDQHGL